MCYVHMYIKYKHGNLYYIYLHKHIMSLYLKLWNYCSFICVHPGCSE